MSMALIRAAADQAAQSADDSGDPVKVGAEEWFRLLDLIYDEEDE